MTLLTLTTDFGEGSPYVAQMKAAALSVRPDLRIVDLTHSVPPQDVRRGAWILAETAWRFPADTLHVAVVDPGVGTERAILAAASDAMVYVGPDNGLLSLVLEQRPATWVRRVENRSWFGETVSPTFHGRDVMVPVAAHLTTGRNPAELGPEIDSWQRLDWPRPSAGPGEAQGCIVADDSFGNLISNLRGEHLQDLPRPLQVEAAGRSWRLVETYGRAEPGDAVALLGSSGWLELAVVQGSARKAVGAREGVAVRVVGSRP